MPNAPASAINPELKSLHEELIAIVAELDAAVGRATTGAEVVTLLDEISEVNARVSNVGRQLFTAQTAEISDGVAAVKALHIDTAEAIKKLESIKKMVGAVTRFLAAVDKVVDIAKLIL